LAPTSLPLFQAVRGWFFDNCVSFSGMVLLLGC
jgi:hypothetical protein